MMPKTKSLYVIAGFHSKDLSSDFNIRKKKSLRHKGPRLKLVWFPSLVDFFSVFPEVCMAASMPGSYTFDCGITWFEVPRLRFQEAN